MKFRCILADPPWQYKDRDKDGIGTDDSYPTMSLEELGSMAFWVKRLADNDCWLWMWTTNAFLVDGSASWLCKKWGFEPKTLVTWIKCKEQPMTLMGFKPMPKLTKIMGYYVFSSTEHLIIAIRGNSTPDKCMYDNVIFAPTREHSLKPDESYKLIEKVCVETPRLELFARRIMPGWRGWGRDYPTKDIMCPTGKVWDASRILQLEGKK